MGVLLGSAQITFAPFFLARTILLPIKGCCSKVFEPITNMHFASSRSRMELVMAPDPKTSARPATVEEWHNLAQWSM